MRIDFIRSADDECRPLFAQHMQTMGGSNDDFWEDNSLTNSIYQITLDAQPVGLCAVEAGGALTLFYLPLQYAKYAQPAFRALRERFHPQYAFAATNDELFLSLCMDDFTSIEKQAYFFTRSGTPARPPAFARDGLRPALPADAADILDKENVAENIAQGKYYVLRENGVFLGQGFYKPMTLTPNAVSIGMSVHPDHRRKGVGRSIIMHLADICRENGKIPLCGCWYYNHNSKKTLESAGFVTRTRLLKVWLEEGTECKS